MKESDAEKKFLNDGEVVLGGDISSAKHKDRAHKMQRLYKRDNGRFIPCAWMCPDCGQMQRY